MTRGGRILAIDWGEKRFGVAMSDPMNLIATPLAVLKRRNGETPWEDFRKFLGEYSIGTVVVGLPLRTDGKAGEKESKVRAWIEDARRQFPDVHFIEMDERFTTREAQRLLREKGIRAIDQRKDLDKISAALILEQFLKVKNP